MRTTEAGRLAHALLDTLDREQAETVDALTAMGSLVEVTIVKAFAPADWQQVSEQFVTVLRAGIERNRRKR